MKIYGNSSSDGFASYVVALCVVAVAGGGLLAIAGAWALVVVPAVVALVTGMVKTASRWEVTSESPPPFGDVDVSAKNSAVAPVAPMMIPQPRYPMPSDNEAQIAPPKSLWMPADDSALPVHVDMQPGKVRTNALDA